MREWRRNPCRSITGDAGHENRFSELFQNLISNAIKYRSEAPVQIQVTAEQLRHEWVVKVKDNGIGIPPEYHDQVFGLLKRLHGREISGTGIGLAICKKIVEAAGGKIWVDSHVGEGSTFCFVPAIE
jgi:signal transduction histidine kinase